MSRGWKNFGRWMDKGGGGSEKLDSFYGRHMCIIPKCKFCNLLKSLR